MMGLGKTIQAIALLWMMLKKDKFTDVVRAKKAVVVTPSSLLYHWQKEVRKWLGDKRLSPLICQGDKKYLLSVLRKFIDDPS